MEELVDPNNVEVVWNCRFHPHNWWHEVGCPHMDWTREQLQQALVVKKQGDALPHVYDSDGNLVVATKTVVLSKEAVETVDPVTGVTVKNKGADSLGEAEIAACKERAAAGAEMISALCQPKGSEKHRDWVMSIPPQPNYDPDLVLGDCIEDVYALIREVAALQERQVHLDELMQFSWEAFGRICAERDKDKHENRKLKKGLEAAEAEAARLRDRYRWRPIAEIHEDLGECVLMRIDDPGWMVVGNNLDEDFNEPGWTHFTQIPPLPTEEAEELKSAATDAPEDN